LDAALQSRIGHRVGPAGELSGMADILGRLRRERADDLRIAVAGELVHFLDAVRCRIRVRRGLRRVRESQSDVRLLLGPFEAIQRLARYALRTGPEGAPPP